VPNVRDLIAQTLPPWPSLWRCALTGVFGIASGFAVFLLWLDEISRGPVRFVVALGVAVLVAFTFESMKEELEGHEHHWQAPRLLVLVVLLTMAEVFVMGYHSAVSLTPERLRETIETLLGEDVAGWHAAGIVGVWLVLGGAVAVGLGATIFNAGCEIPEDEPLSWSKPAVWGWPMLRSAFRGGLTGALAGPLCMLLYIFLVRFVFEYVWILAEPGRWRAHLRGAAQAVSASGGVAWLVWLPLQAIQLLDGVFGVFGRVGPLLTLATLVAVLIVCARRRAGRAFFVILVGVLIAYGYPVLAKSGRALVLAGLMAYVWAVPGILLGALTPWLKRPAGYPKLWGVVAFGAAAILVVGSLAIPWFIMPAVVFAAVGFWFRRGVQVEQYWAVLALSVATNVFGATHLVTRADFFHIQRDTFELTKVPLQAFAYQAVTLDPKLQEAIRRSLFSEEFLRGLNSPSLQSPFPPPGSSTPLFRFPDLLSTTPVSPEIQLAADLEAVRAERDRTAKVVAGLAERVKDLAAMETRAAQERKEIGGLKALEYQEHHKRLRALAAWTGEAITRRESLVTEATTTLDAEGKRHAATAAALSRIETLRDEQLRLQSERQQLLETARQMKERGEPLRTSLVALKDAVERQAADLHNMALRAFEVALTASSGFWITLGLLASWSIRRPRTAP
jgi:hypothetical protein